MTVDRRTAITPTLMTCAYCFQRLPWTRSYWPSFIFARCWLCSEHEWLADARRWAARPRLLRRARWR